MPEPDDDTGTAAGAPAQITRADVAHLAGLARISLGEAELDRLAGELPKILDSVATVSQALEGAGDVEPMSHPTPLRNVFRPDRVHRSLTPEEALEMAPAREDDRFLVPKILGEE
jgi:aspartyl-tRNA(Asn)/glutamyl-tRNA(Gln) amidotransferase subunit C